MVKRPWPGRTRSRTAQRPGPGSPDATAPYPTRGPERPDGGPRTDAGRARRTTPKPVLLLAVLGLVLVAGGCGASPDEVDPGCREVRASADALAAEITSLGAQVEAGTAPNDGTLQEREQEWAELVLGDRQCFSAERVAVALTVLQPAQG